MRHYQQKITSSNHLNKNDWQELWQRRELLGVLVRRDLQVRYKNTTLGVVWVILQPLLSTLIFTLIFARLLKNSLGAGDNYLISTFIGFIFWQFFSGSLTQAAGSIYEQIGMVKKIYFPRLYLPLTIICRAFFDLLVATLLLVVLMFITHTPFSLVGVATFVLVALALFLFTSGLSFIFAGLNARFRDFRHLTPFVLQLWLYATPVFYPISLLANSPLAWVNHINPLTQLLELVRAATFSHTFSWQIYLFWLFLSLLTWYLGFWLFKKMETIIVDWT